MRNYLSQSSPVVRVFSILADLALLNLLWLVCSVPILTIGAASAALYHCLFSRERGESCGARVFFHAFSAGFRPATFLWSIVLCAGIIFYVDYWFVNSALFPLHQILLALYAAIGLVVLIALPFLFVPPALDAKTVPLAIKASFLLGVANLPRTVAILLLWSIPLVWMIVFPYSFWRFAWIWIGLGFGGIAYLSAKIIQKPLHITEG